MSLFSHSFVIVEIIVAINWVVFLESESGLYLLKLLVTIFTDSYGEKNPWERIFFFFNF